MMSFFSTLMLAACVPITCLSWECRYKVMDCQPLVAASPKPSIVEPFSPDEMLNIVSWPPHPAQRVLIHALLHSHGRQPVGSHSLDTAVRMASQDWCDVFATIESVIP